MNTFSISDLQDYSGIKAHTIRIWEQRYNALQPNRSEGNTRYYDGNQLRRLLNIVSLMESKHKISDLCAMTDESLYILIEAKFQNNGKNENGNEYFISQLIAAATNFDEPFFEKIFANCVIRLGLRNTYLEIIFPLLNRMGLMWASGNRFAAYEHFSSNLIMQKLNAAIDALPPNDPANSSTWVLFLPENEYHEIGLLFSYYILRLNGKKVIYLGSNLPLDMLIGAAEKIKPNHLLFFLVHNNTQENSQIYLNELKKYFGKSKIHISGNKNLIEKLKLGKEIFWEQSIEDLEKQ